VKYNRLFPSFAVLLFLGPTGCETPDSAGSKSPAATASTEEAPLLLQDEETPLLLGDSPESAEGNGETADNSRCFVCHLNYAREELAVSHARAKIGCARCHGESDDHIADESWASGGNGTAPDIMYPKEKINPFCLSCHPAHELSAEEHEDVASTSSKEVCTDCHGRHRLPRRKCRWK